MMKLRRFSIAIAFGLGVLSTPAFAFAQDQQPPPPQSKQPALTQSATDTFDSVHLRSGGLFRGRVTEIVPDDHVTIVLDGGETKQLRWSEIERIVTSTVPAPPPNTGVIKIPAPTPITPPPTSPSEMPPPTTPQDTQWRANRPLLVTGAILFASGYGPNVIAGAPSTIGLLGRVVILVLTLGLPCFFNNSRDYLCSGEHGAVQLLIPFAGPILFANDHPEDSIINQSGRPVSGLTKGLLYTSSGLQIAGVISILGSLVFGGHEPVPQRKANTGLPSLYLAPISTPNTVGVTVGIHRW